jgi:hypothetical protein
VPAQQEVAALCYAAAAVWGSLILPPTSWGGFELGLWQYRHGRCCNKRYTHSCRGMELQQSVLASIGLNEGQ